jgi:hypothetical protein
MKTVRNKKRIRLTKGRRKRKSVKIVGGEINPEEMYKKINETILNEPISKENIKKIIQTYNTQNPQLLLDHYMGLRAYIFSKINRYTMSSITSTARSKINMSGNKKDDVLKDIEDYFISKYVITIEDSSI